MKISFSMKNQKFALLFSIIVSLGNFLFEFPINEYLTWGAFVFPFNLFLADYITRRYGAKISTTAIYWGFFYSFIVVFSIVSWKIAIASCTAFLVSEIIDVFVFRAYIKTNSLLITTIISGVVAGAIDVLLFTIFAVKIFDVIPLKWYHVFLGDYIVRLCTFMFWIPFYRQAMKFKKII